MAVPHIRQTIKVVLAEKDLKLADVARFAKADYRRWSAVLCGTRKPKAGELAEIVAAVERLSAARSAGE